MPTVQPEAPVIRVLGRVGLGTSAVEEGLASSRGSALLAMLALRAGTLVPTEHLVDGIWGDDPPASVRNALQVHASALRKALVRSGVGGDQPLVGTSTGYQLRVPRSAVDALAAEDLLKASRVAALHGRADEAEQLATTALDLWYGPELGGVGSAAFVEAARPRLRQLRSSLTDVVLDAWLGAGRHQQVVELTEDALVENPFDEGLWRRLVLALHRLGRTADALAAFERAARRLRDELGLDPGPELSALQASVLRDDPALLRPPGHHAGAEGAGGGVSVEPEQPDPSTSSGDALPFEATTLIGRAAEVTAVGRMFHADGQRLVSVLGPGGMGKTRLAVAVARECFVAAGSDVAFVDLSSITTTAGMLEEMIRAVAGQPGSGDLVDRLADLLGSRSLLMVLDNVEQLAPTAGAAMSQLLARAPGVRLLVTTRVALNVAAESRFVLNPLDDPDAMALFAARARAVLPGFRADAVAEPLVLDICRTLDNIPLALELAAARLRVVSLADTRRHVAAHSPDLRSGPDAPDRHRTLRSAISGSVDLLTPRTRDALVQLSVFHGGFTLGAAAQVLGVDDGTAVDHLEELVDSSLLVGPAAEDVMLGTRAPRFTLLEPIRQYLGAMLEGGGGAAAARARHATYYLQHFVEGDARAGRDPDSVAVTEDFANLDAAIVHLAVTDGSAATRLIESVYRRVTLLGRLPQLRSWAVAAREGGSTTEIEDARLRSICGHVDYQVSTEWPRGMEDFLDAVHTLIEEASPSFTVVQGISQAAGHLADTHQLDDAMVMAQHGVRLARVLGEPSTLNLALNAAQYVARCADDLEAAIAYGLEAVALVRTGGDRAAVISALSESVNTLVSAGRAADSTALAEEAVSLLVASDGPQLKAIAVRGYARSLVGRGRDREAVASLLELDHLDTLSSYAVKEPGWIAFALRTIDPALAATVLGAARRMVGALDDPEILPPPAVAGDFAAHLAAAHPDEVARGERLGWEALRQEVRDRAARLG